jgi:hypothetical protein
MSADDAEVQMTERGRQALRAPDGLRADHLLYLEILARIGGCAGGKNVDDMTDELIAHFGSAEAALTAVKCGEVGFQKMTDDDRFDRPVSFTWCLKCGPPFTNPRRIKGVNDAIP